MDFFLGVLATMIVLGFFVSAVNINKEHEIYEEGFRKGKEENDRNN